MYLRRANRLGQIDPTHETVIEASVNDYQALYQAMASQGIVYANLGGELKPKAKNIVKAMTAAGVSSLIYVAGLGLYHDVPGAFGCWVEANVGTTVMDDTRRATQLIEGQQLGLHPDLRGLPDRR